MVTFENLRGQSGYIARLQEEFTGHTCSHSYLFTGPAGTGKKSAAVLCMMAALCRGEEKKPCGKCGPCRRIQGGTHPDVHTVLPPEGKKIIPVSTIRDVFEEAGVSSFEGGLKFFYFPQAERLNPQAQNVLLKTLEEPPADTVFLLVTDQPSALLPTVVSRCRIVRFHPLGAAECEKRLMELGKTPAQAKQYARISEGCVGKALDLDENLVRNLRQVTSDFFSLRDAADIPEVLGKLQTDKELLKAIPDILEAAVRDILLEQSGGPELPEGLYAEAAEKYAQAVPPEGGLALASKITLAKKQSESNVSKLSVIEEILFELTEEYHQWPW